MRDENGEAPASACEVIGIDHIYVTVSDLARAEAFYDKVFSVLGFRKNRFTLAGDAHVQYYNRLFGYVLRPARSPAAHDAYAPGLHHLCLRVATAAEVEHAASSLQHLGVAASAPQIYAEYSPDYVATFFADPDGLRLEITNFRQERRERQKNWDSLTDTLLTALPPGSESSA